ncbi:MAG: hypothetical protein IKF36_01645 [Bacilli bacterium]|nr:hypothetical protein [Bacilli bacterium]
MRKTIKRLGVLFLSTFLIVIMTGCGSSSKGLEGQWNYYDESSKKENKDIYYTFNGDNTGSYTFYSDKKKFTYEDKGNKVKISYENTTIPNEFEYVIEDDMLIIKDSVGSDVKYKRK